MSNEKQQQTIPHNDNNNNNTKDVNKIKELTNKVNFLASKILEQQQQQYNNTSQTTTNNLENFEELKKQFQSIPRLNKKQFEQLPKIQREQYIKMLENIVTKISSLLIFNHSDSLNNNFNNDFNNEFNKMTTTTIDQQQLLMNDYLKGFDNLKDITPITLKAMQIAIDRRKEKERKEIEEQRNELIKKYKFGKMIKKLTFQLKCLKLKNDLNSLQFEKQEFINFHFKKLKDNNKNDYNINNILNNPNFLILQFIYELFSDIQWIKLIIFFNYFDKEDWIEKIPLLSNYLKINNIDNHPTNLNNNLNNILNDFIIASYQFEECLLYLLFNENYYQSIKRYEINIDNEMELKRKEKTEKLKEIEIYNKNLIEKWEHLTEIEKLRFYTKEEMKNYFDNILQKSRELGLQDDKVIEVFLETYKNNNLFISEFNPNEFKEKLPIKELSLELKDGFHNKSFEIAKDLNVSEKLITFIYFNKNIKDYNEIYKIVKNILNINSFKEYYNNELKGSEMEEYLLPTSKL